MQNTKLQSIKNKLPLSIQKRIEAVLQEEDAYAADELVELCETILNELAAIGFAIYLKQENQKEIYNDFLIGLFAPSSQDYNAGPLFRWAANMIKSIDTPEAKKIKHLFWEEGNEFLRVDTNAMSLLRNKVMHGFFVLPPETNKQETENIAVILEELLAAELFAVFEKEEFHFLSKSNEGVSFKDSWSINDEGWKRLEKAYRFGEVAHTIRFQDSEKFNLKQIEAIHVLENEFNVTEIEALFKNKPKGAFAVWKSPYKRDNIPFLSLVKKLLNDANYIPVFYQIEEVGISYTEQFLLQKIVDQLVKYSGIKDFPKDLKKAVVMLRKSSKAQLIVVLNHIETALFNKNHVLHLTDFFYENNIVVVAFGINIPWMHHFFNDSIQLPFEIEKMGNQWKDSLHNYLRYKGPNKELDQDMADYSLLLEIGEKLVNDISLKKEVVARRFADEYNYPIEFVHEMFAVLNPYFKSGNQSFEEDEIDELYGFPKELTESSNIYLSLGRRDVKLEYKHKTLSI